MVAGLHVHKEGLEFLRDMGIAAFVLVVVALRFSSWPVEFLFRIVERVARNFPPSTPDSGPNLDQKTLRKQNRRRREQMRRTLREAKRRIQRKRSHRRVLAFDWFVGALGLYLLLDWRVMPEGYRLPNDRRWPLALAIFLSGSLIIFIGSQVWDGRVGWKKWTFWLSLLGTGMLVLCLTMFWKPVGLDAGFLVLLAGAIFFFWLFGKLRHVDRSEKELREINETVSDGTLDHR
jgi:hypothetical protein